MKKPIFCSQKKRKIMLLIHTHMCQQYCEEVVLITRILNENTFNWEDISEPKKRESLLLERLLSLGLVAIGNNLGECPLCLARPIGSQVFYRFDDHSDAMLLVANGD